VESARGGWAGGAVSRRAKVAAIAAASTGPSKAKVLAMAQMSKKSFMRELAIPSAVMAWNFSASTVSGG